MTRPIAALLILAALPGLARADARPPSDVARAYIQALKAEDWPAVVGLMDRQDLQTAHTLMKPALKKFVALKRKWPSPMKEILEGLTGPADVDRLTPTQTFVRLLRGSLRSINRAGGSLRNAEFAILGEVRETPTLVHVVYRAHYRIQDLTFRSLSIISLVRRGDAWRVKLDENMRQMALLFQRMAQKL